MSQYKVDMQYYEQPCNGSTRYVMGANVINKTNNMVLLCAAIDPDDYFVEGYIEDDNGAYYDESLVDEACFQELQKQILAQAKMNSVDPECLVFTRIRECRDETAGIKCFTLPVELED